MSIIMSTPVSTPAAPSQGQAVQAAQALPAVPGQPSSGAAAGATPAAAGSTAAAATTTAGTQGAAAAASPAAPFAQWLGQQADGADAQPQPQLPPQLPSALSSAATLPGGFAAVLPAAVMAPAGTVPAAAAPVAADGKPAADADKTKDAGTGVTQDNTLLAAMAMPLMPLSPMQIAQAVQIAQGGSAAGSSGSGDTRTAAAAQPAVDGLGVNALGAAPAGAVAAGHQDGGRRADIALPQLAAQAAPPAPSAPAAQPARQDAAVRLATQAAGGNAGFSIAAPADGAAQDSSSAAQNGNPAAPAVAVAAAPATAQPADDSVKLAGPPTAWRQSLQEALGDRLNVQVGKNVEQAVIRLEPPQLGRIDIAIRHSNGTLEVNISATHGEVLRQLQTVSDNLRNDLAQRQYVDVAVSVTPAPKGGSASPFGDPNQQQQQGRGRGQGHEQGNEQNAPSRALAEANHATSAFSLGGREA